jgi:heme exporter protein A
VRRFGETTVLGGVDLVVAAGETVALLGPNGAGKTTLLRVLALLLRPSAGRLALFGAAAASAPPALRRRIGYVGHESLCYPDLTAGENLAFYARLYEVPDGVRRVHELLVWAGLEGAARRPVRVYSRGMSQRLALARALLHRPELLLLDEPFTGLDPEAARALDERLLALRAAGCAVVFTTHDLERVATLATRAAILHRGRIAWTGDGGAPAGAVTAAYRSVVGGSPA